MSVDNVELFRRIEDRLRKELVPELKVYPKSALRLHSLINFILNLVYPKSRKDSYLRSSNTTIGYTVAMAEYAGTKDFGNWRTLCHEADHALQAKTWTRVLFGWLYLWPISQGALMLFAGWVGVLWVPGWWKALYLASWLVITGLHFIPQIPDPWRSHWEFHAYSISMHLRYLVYHTVDQRYIDALVNNFSSMMYFMMEPDKDKIRTKLEQLAEDIRSGTSEVKDHPIVKIAEDEYYRMMNE